ncbi:hypothetical protein G3N95_24300 [Paraburkholderia sp. Tr-20389]|uniref:hypothetical protein n=1 Tax=Paraburkholderia sp. Tr-20389 TaxID=2703903 RepID=UPI00197E23D6|nr:hypothetical protein [Paraburkholderia sp. Tr-20389]MBN3756084.1 hypothetical protein [Paraburkholderia sp. Tr-20389]
MKVVIMNEGENPIRVIVDGDNVDDSTLQPGEDAALESRQEGVIELRELGGLQAERSGEAAT